MSRLLTLATIFALCFVAVAPQEAVAKPKSRSKKVKKVKEDPKNALIIQALGTLKWGDSKDDVVKKLREEAMAELGNDTKLKNDRIRMQEALKLVRERSKRLEDTYTKLDGPTNLEVSVIGDEFMTKNGESFLRITDTRSQRYFFFMRDRLYKYVVAYNKYYLEDVSFKDFVAATAEKYGRPTDAIFDEEDDDKLVSVEWKANDVILVVKDKQRFFGTYTMTFAEPKLYAAWATRKKTQQVERRAAEEEVSSEVKSLLQTGDVQLSDSVVSNLVGETNIDIYSVVPKKKSAEEEERKKAEEEEKKKKAAEAKKKKKKKKRSKGKGGALDLDLNSSGSSKGLIIY